MKPASIKGFTLIELLIVISIILILSVLGIGSYRGIRSALTLDLETDRLVALLQGLQSQTRATSVSKGHPECLRVIFEKDAQPTELTAEYKNPVEGCQWNAATSFTLPLSPDVVFMNGMTISFSPPDGQVFASFTPSTATDLTLSNKQNSTITRKISVNTITGTIQKIKP